MWVIAGAVAAMAQSDPPLSENLIRYLALTPEQVREIASNDGQFNERNSARSGRYGVLSGLIQEDEAPLALGTRFVEIEMLRREMVADIRAVRAKNRALMTPEQRERLARIENTRPLALISYQAVCAGVVRPDPARPLFAYYCFPSGPGSALRAFLNLTETQLAVFDAVGREVNQVRRDADARLSRLGPLIEIETASDPLNPARLGALRAEERRLQVESYNARFAFMDRLRSVLTPSQEAKLRDVQELLPLRRLLPVAECEGLIPSVAPRDLYDPVAGQINFETLYCAGWEGQ